MREKTKLMIKKVHDLLINNNYLTTNDLSKSCHLSRYTIYRIIRQLRLEGVGIIPTKNGYVLSESAQKSDDVGFIRRCFGRRTSDLIALHAAEKDISKRWKGVEDKNNINQVFKYLSLNPTNEKKAENGLKYMLTHINNKGN